MSERKTSHKMIVDNRPPEIKQFMKVMRMFSRSSEKQLSRIGIYRGQDIILFILNDHGSLSQKSLVELFNCSKATITSSLQRMEKNGLLYRKEDPEDARCNKVYLTDKGKKVAKECEEIISRIQDALFSQFDETEKREAENIFSKMCYGLKTLERNEND